MTTTLPAPLEMIRRRARLFRKVLLLSAGHGAPMVQLFLERVAGALDDLEHVQTMPPSSGEMDPKLRIAERKAVLDRIETAVRDIAMALTGREWQPVQPSVVVEEPDWEIKV